MTSKKAEKFLSRVVDGLSHSTAADESILHLFKTVIAQLDNSNPIRVTIESDIDRYFNAFEQSMKSKSEEAPIPNQFHRTSSKQTTKLSLRKLQDFILTNQSSSDNVLDVQSLLCLKTSNYQLVLDSVKNAKNDKYHSESIPSMISKLSSIGEDDLLFSYYWSHCVFHYRQQIDFVRHPVVSNNLIGLLNLQSIRRPLVGLYCIGYMGYWGSKIERSEQPLARNLHQSAQFIDLMLSMTRQFRLILTHYKQWSSHDNISHLVLCIVMGLVWVDSFFQPNGTPDQVAFNSVMESVRSLLKMLLRAILTGSTELVWQDLLEPMLSAHFSAFAINGDVDSQPPINDTRGVVTDNLVTWIASSPSILQAAVATMDAWILRGEDQKTVSMDHDSEPDLLTASGADGELPASHLGNGKKRGKANADLEGDPEDDVLDFYVDSKGSASILESLDSQSALRGADDGEIFQGEWMPRSFFCLSLALTLPLSHSHSHSRFYASPSESEESVTSWENPINVVEGVDGREEEEAQGSTNNKRRHRKASGKMAAVGEEVEAEEEQPRIRRSKRGT